MFLMVGVTFYSFLMSYWTMTVLIMVFFILRYFMRMRYRIRDLLLILVLCLGRTILPFEFSFTKEIPAANMYNAVWQVLNNKAIGILSIGNLLILVWVIGTIAFLLESFRLRFMLHKSIIKSTDDITDVITKNYAHVFDKLGRKIPVRIYESNTVSIPYSFGIFKKGIVIPANSKESDIPYFLMHEYGHHVHKDLLIMTIIDVWLAVFWWSPFSYLLRHKMEETLELNCDYLVTKNMSASEKKDYLRSIVSALKNSSVDKRMCKASTMGLVRFNNKKFVVERFENITKRKDKQGKVLSAVFYLIVGLIVASSYTVVLQSEFPLEENDENGYVIESIMYDEENNVYITNIGNEKHVLSDDELVFFESIGVEIEKGSK